jgi:hypothetical protein
MMIRQPGSRDFMIRAPPGSLVLAVRCSLQIRQIRVLLIGSPPRG